MQREILPEISGDTVSLGGASWPSTFALYNFDRCREPILGGDASGNIRGTPRRGFPCNEIDEPPGRAICIQPLQ